MEEAEGKRKKWHVQKICRRNFEDITLGDDKDDKKKKKKNQRREDSSLERLISRKFR
jgi:hypothetical protein